MSNLFNEKKVQSENKHAEIDLKTGMEVGESIGFYFDNTRTATSEQYGDFLIAQGLTVDYNAKSIDAFVESGEAGSFIPNTLLLNKIEEGTLLEGEAYRIEFSWDKGQKFKDGRISKGYGYTLFHLAIEPEVKKQLADQYKALTNGLNTEESGNDKKKKKKKKK